MTILELFSLAGGVTGILSLFSVLYFSIVKMAKIELKVDTMWDFITKRGVTEGLQKGFFTMNSPISIPENLRDMVTKAVPALRSFYLKTGQGMTDAELAYEIERRYGTQILKKVCVPNGMPPESGLVIAIAVAKNNSHGLDIVDEV